MYNPFTETRDFIAQQREWLSGAEAQRGHMPEFILDQIIDGIECVASRTAATVRFYKMRLLSRRENTREDARQWLSLYATEAFALRDDLIGMVDELLSHCTDF